MGKSSIKYSLPSADHSVRDGVEGKVCRGKHSQGAAHWVALTGYWSNDSYVDGRAETCAACYGQWRRERDTAKKSESKALTLRDARPVVFDDGTRASVGWHGDVEYFPITPLLALTRYTSEPGLLDAIKADVHMGTSPRKFLVNTQAGVQRDVWHLPWTHFNTFCLKFGNEQTKPQQARAQRVLEAAFGKTAQSNREAVTAIDAGDVQVSFWQPDVEHGMRRVVKEEVRQALSEENERLETRTLRGKDVYIDRPVDGRVYIAEEDRRVLQASTSMDVLRRLDRGWRYLFISQSGRGEDERLAEYTKKRPSGLPVPTLRKVILSDARRRLEPALHASFPDGVWKVPGKRDEFMVSPEAYERLMELPSYIGSIDIPRLKQWILCQTIFETV